MGAMTDVTDDEQTVGISTRTSCKYLTTFSTHYFDGFSAESDSETDGLPGGSTDESDDV